MVSPLLGNEGSGIYAPAALQANRKTGIITTKAVSECCLPNATITPEITLAGSKGITDLGYLRTSRLGHHPR